MLRTQNFDGLSDAGNFAIQEDKIRNMNKARQSLYRSGFNPSTRPTHHAPNTSSRPPLTQNQDNPCVPQSKPINRTFEYTKTCNYCKKPRHLIPECRKLAYNNSKCDQHTLLAQSNTAYRPPVCMSNE